MITCTVICNNKMLIIIPVLFILQFKINTKYKIESILVTDDNKSDNNECDNNKRLALQRGGRIMRTCDDFSHPF